MTQGARIAQNSKQQCDVESGLYRKHYGLAINYAKHNQTGYTASEPEPLPHHYHFIREHVDSGLFDPQWVSTSLNVADIFTKSLPRPARMKFVSMLSLVPL